jgi:predicted acyltransferase
MDNPTAPSLPQRMMALDAYRGFVMFLMMAEVLRFSTVAAALLASGFWQFLAHHQSHVAWVGCSLHDLIQPMFIVDKHLTTHLGASVFKVCGEAYVPLLHGAAVLLVFWLILFWMYRRKIFLRI